MKYGYEHLFIYSFGLLCALVTIGLCAYWCYKFGLDEELSVIHYTKFFDTNDDVFPTVSLCFRNPFIEGRLATYGINGSLYFDFLAGNLFSKELMRVN